MHNLSQQSDERYISIKIESTRKIHSRDITKNSMCKEYPIIKLTMNKPTLLTIAIGVVTKLLTKTKH